MNEDAAHLKKAQEVTRRLEGIAKDAISPVRRLLRDPGWKPEFRRILIMAVRNELNALELEMT